MNRNLNRRIHPIAEADGLSPKKPRKESNILLFVLPLCRFLLPTYTIRFHCPTRL